LKDFQPGISSVDIQKGSTPGPLKPPPKPQLASTNPSPGSHLRPRPVPGTDYDTTDLEQRGWDVLRHVLETADGPELVDFRRRHGVGADGAIDWKKFVELKASGRSATSTAGMSITEFRRAVESGNDYILALVSGLEHGYETQVKLIFDPARRAGVSETVGIRLTGLKEAAGVVVRLSHDGSFA
jgi:hypothetical protein